jgi:hypothetical protein
VAQAVPRVRAHVAARVARHRGPDGFDRPAPGARRRQRPGCHHAKQALKRVIHGGGQRLQSTPSPRRSASHFNLVADSGRVATPKCVCVGDKRSQLCAVSTNPDVHSLSSERAGVRRRLRSDASLLSDELSMVNMAARDTHSGACEDSVHKDSTGPCPRSHARRSRRSTNSNLIIRDEREGARSAGARVAAPRQRAPPRRRKARASARTPRWTCTPSRQPPLLRVKPRVVDWVSTRNDECCGGYRHGEHTHTTIAVHHLVRHTVHATVQARPVVQRRVRPPCRRHSNANSPHPGISPRTLSARSTSSKLVASLPRSTAHACGCGSCTTAMVRGHPHIHVCEAVLFDGPHIICKGTNHRQSIARKVDGD